MDPIIWCLKQKRGIELVEPNENLSNAYLRKAEESLEALQSIAIRDWQLTVAYYTIYYSLYSLLMKIGIKSEIHACTITFAKKFLKEYFLSEDFLLIEKAFSARIDAQYYVNRNVPDDHYQLILQKTPGFLVKCKNIVITETAISEIRKQLTTYSSFE